MRILVVHPYMRVLGGAERVCFHVIRALLESGHEVKLVSEPFETSVLESYMGFKIPRVNHIIFRRTEPRIKKISAIESFTRNILERDRIRKQVDEADVEILTKIYYINFCSAKKVAYINGPREVLQYFSKIEPKKFWNEILKHFIKSHIDEVNLFLCNSNFTKNLLAQKLRKRIEVLYPPVDIENFSCSHAKEKTVVTLGRFDPFKKYEAIFQVAKLLPHVKFKIIARKESDEYYKMLKKFKPSNVILLANLNAREIAAELAKAKIYLHSAINEPFGISIVEAMASGCVPIVHNSGGPREVVGNAGYLYNNLEECAELIKWALDSSFDVNKIRERSKLFSSEKFRSGIMRYIK